MELGLCLILLALLGSSRSEFLKGVNYGNAFIPEDWMTNDQESIYGERYGSRVSQPSDVARVSLCDVTDDRILRWLEDETVPASSSISSSSSSSSSSSLASSSSSSS